MTSGAIVRIAIKTSGHAVIKPLLHADKKVSVDAECKKIMMPETISAVQQDIINAKRTAL